jgi:hypothetical protein
MEERIMVGRRDARRIDESELPALRERLAEAAPDQARALEPGCRIWHFVNAEGFDGEIVVWPDDRRAALISDAASHWGVWNAAERTITLDDGDIYSEVGGVGEDA